MFKIQVTNAAGTNAVDTGYTVTDLAGASSVARCLACDDREWVEPFSPTARLARLRAVDENGVVIIREFN
jgi:hypothetical protein